MSGNALDKAKQLQDRSKRFAIRIINMFRALPKTDEARIIGKQVLRSGASVAANYRAACRGRSKAEFAAKMGIVVEEIDETVFWMELLVDAEIVTMDKMKALISEGNELLAIFAASRRTAKLGN